MKGPGRDHSGQSNLRLNKESIFELSKIVSAQTTCCAININIKKESLKKEFFIMSDPLLREMDNFVVLEPGVDERFLTAQETLSWLSAWLKKIEELTPDLKQKPSLEAAAEYLLDTSCELSIKPGFTIQWYAVRLDPSKN